MPVPYQNPYFKHRGVSVYTTAGVYRFTLPRSGTKMRVGQATGGWKAAERLIDEDLNAGSTRRVANPMIQIRSAVRFNSPKGFTVGITPDGRTLAWRARDADGNKVYAAGVLTGPYVDVTDLGPKTFNALGYEHHSGQGITREQYDQIREETLRRLGASTSNPSRRRPGGLMGPKSRRRNPGGSGRYLEELDGTVFMHTGYSTVEPVVFETVIDHSGPPPSIVRVRPLAGGESYNTTMNRLRPPQDGEIRINPKMVGHEPRALGATVIGNNASHVPGHTRVSFAQARLAHDAGTPVIASLDTTDRGGRKSLAKRWYRWFVPTEAATGGWATPSVRRRAWASASTSRSTPRTNPTSTTAKQVADTILRQMGGQGRIMSMIGAKHLMYGTEDGDDFVSFQFPNTGKAPNYVKVLYCAGTDLYRMKFARIRGTNVVPISAVNDIYADQLKPVFERATGLYLSL